MVEAHVCWIKFRAEDVVNYTPRDTRTVIKEIIGWVIDEDEKYLYVARTKNDFDVLFRWEDVMLIPKGAVVDIEVYDIFPEVI